MNKVENYKKKLKIFKIFSKLNDYDIEKIAYYTIEKNYNRGDTIFYENEPGRKLYLILSGNVKLCIFSDDGKEHVLGTIFEGEFFGELSILDKEERSTSALAIDDVNLLIIDRDAFLEVLKDNPYIIYYLILSLCKKIRWTDKHLNTLAFLSSHGKVAKLILDMSNEIGNKIGEKIYINHKLTRQEMANIIGSSRETLTRIIIEYKNENLIDIKKNQIIVIDSEKLNQKIFKIN